MPEVILLDTHIWLQLRLHGYATKDHQRMRQAAMFTESIQGVSTSLREEKL